MSEREANLELVRDAVTMAYDAPSEAHSALESLEAELTTLRAELTGQTDRADGLEELARIQREAKETAEIERDAALARAEEAEAIVRDPAKGPVPVLVGDEEVNRYARGLEDRIATLVAALRETIERVEQSMKSRHGVRGAELDIARRALSPTGEVRGEG